MKLNPRSDAEEVGTPDPAEGLAALRPVAKVKRTTTVVLGPSAELAVRPLKPDLLLRSQYARSAAEIPKHATRLYDEAAATLSKAHPAGDLDTLHDAARFAFEQRERLKFEIRSRLSPAASRFTRKVARNRSFEAQLFRQQRRLKRPTADAHVYRAVISAAGRTRPWVNVMTVGLRYAGRALLVVSVTMSVARVTDAALHHPDEVAQVLGEETSLWALGLAGCGVGAAVGMWIPLPGATAIGCLVGGVTAGLLADYADRSMPHETVIWLDGP